MSNYPDYNLCSFIGNLVKDPEEGTTASGNVKVKLVLAMNKPMGNDEAPSQFLNFTAFNTESNGGLAGKVAGRYKKGDRVILTGKYQNDTRDNGDGTKTYFSWFLLSDIQYAGGGKKADADSSTTTEPAPRLTPQRSNAPAAPSRPAPARSVPTPTRPVAATRPAPARRAAVTEDDELFGG